MKLFSRTMVLFLALVVASCGGTGAPSPPGEPAPAGASKVAPDFALESVDGQVVRLSDSAGKVRVIDFWATWCAPCREEIPMFEELHATYREQGLEIIGIALGNEEPSVVRDYVREQGMSYTNLIGNDQVAADYPAPGLPTTYLIDREGRLSGEPLFGAKPRKVLEERIRALLGPPTQG